MAPKNPLLNFSVLVRLVPVSPRPVDDEKMICYEWRFLDSSAAGGRVTVEFIGDVPTTSGFVVDVEDLPEMRTDAAHPSLDRAERPERHFLPVIKRIDDSGVFSTHGAPPIGMSCIVRAE